MRVLMLAQWYPPLVGGEELHVANLSSALVAGGHEVTVATLLQEGLEAESLDGGVRVVRLQGALQRLPGLFADDARRSAAPIADPLLTTGIDRLVRRFRPDVMHAHNWMVHAALPVRAARGIPLVQTLHDFSLVCATKVLLRQGVDCSGPGVVKCLRCAAHHYGPAKGAVTTIANWTNGLAQRRLVDAFIPVSRAIADGNDLGGLRHEIIPNFVPDDAPSGVDAAAYLDRLPKEPYFLYVGALGRLKGLDVLLDAYRADAGLPPLALVGYPMRETDELLQDLPPHVKLLGEWPYAAVQSAWAGAIANVLPSVCKEACPTVVIEAMRAGRPSIGSSMGGIPDLIVDGETGLLVEPGSRASLGDALRRLADDPQMAQRYGQAAARRALEFKASAVVPRIEAVYRSVISGSPA
jgi:glycosyltransferase involved in cell wall biosynthesis